MALLLVVASILPLILAASFDIAEGLNSLRQSTNLLLDARCEQLRDKLDGLHLSYRNSVERASHMAELVNYSDTSETRAKIQSRISIWPRSDSRVRGIGVIDKSGKVIIATENGMIGRSMARHRYVKEALEGKAVTSDIYFGETDSIPVMAYAAPVFGSTGKVDRIISFWVKAEGFSQMAKASNNLAGPGSYAVLVDEVGIRLAHTTNEEVDFHPGGQLPPDVKKEIIAEQRFGDQTEAFLNDVRPFPEQFKRARATNPDGSLFRGYGQGSKTWALGVARRSNVVPWTIFYMIPEATIRAEMEKVARERILFGLAIIMVAVLVGGLLVRPILKPIHGLAQAAKAIESGNLGARVGLQGKDELGQLAESFDSMATTVQEQSETIRRERDELDERVKERTAQLTERTELLNAEMVERRAADAKVQAQLERMNLLHHITRAAGERQDLKSIFQVVIRSVEDQLPVDFACVCLYDGMTETLTVNSIGIHSETLSVELSMTEDMPIPIDENGLSSCIRGRLVYEPDIREVDFPFPQRLAKGGLRSVVLAPLLVESQVFGIFVTARKEPNSFSSGECEFLRQLSEHVALAAHQATLHEALQLAYNDLHQTQQAVMQQERLKALGQMASGIAHDINNAISPVALYTESLLENEQNLSPRARDYLETISRSIDDVAATVARMREFYRQREQQLNLVQIPLNRLVQEVVDLTRARWSDMALQKGISIVMNLELEPNLPAVMGIESEIREMLTNLVFNAVDAMPDGGTLTLSTRTVKRSSLNDEDRGVRDVEIEVRDSGIGMDEETQARCLEPFFTTKGERGTGLGMAMVYGVVQRHQAAMKVESEVGKGTSIKLTFDAAPADGASADRVTWKASTIQPMRILVVDDDPIILKSLRDTLEGQGHLVTSANGGQAGIDVFEESVDKGEPFPIVITDLGMPYIDGRKVSAAIKGRNSSTFVILLTGWGQRLVAEGDVPPHVDCVLNKPPKLRDLHDALLLSLNRGGRA